MTYDPVAYWTARGRTYEADFRPRHYLEQEAALLAVLDGLTFRSVLDVGCGFGRIGALVRARWPDVPYTGVDLSPDQLRAARARLPEAELVESTLADFDPGRKWDLVLAVEVLMHVPPADLPAAIDKLRALARRDVVTVDWVTPIRRPVLGHNFRHDYSALGPPVRTVGLQAIHHLAV